MGYLDRELSSFQFDKIVRDVYSFIYPTQYTNEDSGMKKRVLYVRTV